MLRFRWLDWGLDHPTVCLWAAAWPERKYVYVYREHFKAGLLIRENAEEIIEASKDEIIERSIIDPSANKRDPITGRSLRDEFARWGLYCLPGDRRDRGYDIVKMFLKKDMIKIHPSCKNLIAQLRTVQRTDKTGEDATDALRYGLVDCFDTIFGQRYKDATGEDLKMTGATKFTDEYLKERREVNFNNRWMFPDEGQAKEMNWLLEEV